MSITPPSKEEMIEKNLIIGLIFGSILKNSTLFGLAMQPRKSTEEDMAKIGMTVRDTAISDENIYLKWLGNLQESESGEKIHQKMVDFTNKLASLLKDPSVMKDYRMAMSKLIRANLEKGEFTMGDIEPMCAFLKKNTEVGNLFHQNRVALKNADNSLENYIRENNIKILPKKKFSTEEERKTAAEHLKDARENLITKLKKQHYEALNQFSVMNPQDPKFSECYFRIISLYNQIQRLKNLQGKTTRDSIEEQSNLLPGMLPAFNIKKYAPSPETPLPTKDTPEKPKSF